MASASVPSVEWMTSTKRIPAGQLVAVMKTEEWTEATLYHEHEYQTKTAEVEKSLNAFEVGSLVES